MAEEQTPATIDSIIGRIQEEIGRSKQCADGHSASGLVVARAGAGLPPLTDLFAAEQALAKAQQTWRIGGQLPTMHRLTGLKRFLAAFAGKIFLRVSQLFTRDQREFNLAAMAALQAVISAIRTQSSQWDNQFATGAAQTVAAASAKADLLADRVAALAQELAILRDQLAALPASGLGDRVGEPDAPIDAPSRKTLGADGSST